MSIGPSRKRLLWLAAALTVSGFLATPKARTQQPAASASQPMEDASNLPYMNPALPIEQRVDDLIHRMTLEEKATQLVNQARAVPRLGVPAYDWWSESLHGVAVNGTTEFPEPIGLGATFDPETIHQMAIAISTEGRIKHAQDVRAGHSNIFEGLDFWAPNINIFRDPRWGRGQETYGEDPFLTGRMGVAFVTGMQGDDPKYYRVISTPKHFAVHSGPEPTRHFADVDVSKHDEVDTYLPAFRAAVTEGKAGSVMCSYNSINGQPGCANEFLLQRELRGFWGFNGYVVSDCGAVIDIFNGHHFRPTQAQASAISLRRGMDNECADFFAKVTDDHDYKPYVDAVKQGYLNESEIDTTLRRLFTARIRLGMFDPPDMVPYTKIDEKEMDSAEHRALARKLANESMVLLKNDGVLPLKTGALKIAVVGPLADQTKVLLGNYNGVPTHTVSVMEGLKAEFPSATINYVPGTQFLRAEGVPVPAALLTTPDGKPGLKEDFSTGDLMGGKPTPLASRVIAKADYTGESLPKETDGKVPLLVGWSGFLTPSETGEYNLGFLADGFASLTADGKQVAQEYQTAGAEAKTGRIHLEKGKKVEIKVQYAAMSFGGGAASKPKLQLIWSPVDMKPSPAAAAAAKNADVVVAVVGITSQLEGEEMPVSEEGFLGGDRTSLDLPHPEEELLESVAATGKPLVVVLMNGSALGVNWANQHANAILEAWYSGEEGGGAVAETLSGKNNPAGRLPLTFYKDVSQLPHFEDYSMHGRTYRYFEGTPLYPFGYGLSYSTFSYSNLKLPTTPLKAGDPLTAEVTVTNSGSKAGDEVAQLYLSFPDVKGAPIRALRGFKRVHLDAGASQTVKFELRPRELNMVTEDGDPIIAAGKYTVSVGGGQPKTSAATVSGEFSVDGTLKLSE
ncbi:glycoside hydrolase family 3 C-terminal domain-containing protein [Acidicapsa acidisoli]|uniref:glycoside hydrolase family 3 C-terminal domain-containing protein n=1 Tax=Acidicapsa acidisoli TaxID=1615681 RepID=UPI0021DFA8FA|nr:glycoside hydrolase family 3 C-terminal domain-containing protein [Acidicapsa acidisoli]